MISHPSPTALAHLKQTHSTQLRAHDAHTLQRYKINTETACCALYADSAGLSGLGTETAMALISSTAPEIWW